MSYTIEIPPLFANSKPVGPIPAGEDHGSLFRKEWKGAEGLAEDVRRYGYWMREEAQKRIGHFYPDVEITEEMAQERPNLKQYVGKKLKVIAWLWARTVKSPNPQFSHVDVPLVSTFVLSKKKGQEAYVQPVISEDSYHFEVKTGAIPHAADCGTKANGRGANFLCLLSQTPISGDYIKQEGKASRIGARLLAIVCEGDRGKIYISPNALHETVAQKVPAVWRPEGDVPARLTGGTCVPYGLDQWGKLFSPRQLVALNTFIDLIQEVRAKAVMDAQSAGMPDNRYFCRLSGIALSPHSDLIPEHRLFRL